MADKKSKKYTLTSAKSGVPSRPSGVNTSAQNFFNVVAGSPTFKPQTIKYGGKTYTSTPQYQESGVGGLKTVAVKVGQTVLRDVFGVGKAAPKAVKPISTAKDLGARTRNLPTKRLGPRKPGPVQLQNAAAAKSTWSPKTAPNVVVGRRATGVTGRVLNSPGAQYVRANRAAGVPAGKTVAQMAGSSVKGASRTVGSSVKGTSRTQRTVVGGTATAAALYYTGRATSGDKKPGYVPTARTTKKPGYVPMTASTAAVSKPRSTAGYVPNAPSSPRKKLTPTSNPPTTERKKTTKPGGNGKTTIGGGQVPGRRPGTSVRTYAVQKRLDFAADAAAAGNFAAAAAYANAALNIQKKGKGTAASMKKVQKVAAAYAKAAKK